MDICRPVTVRCQTAEEIRRAVENARPGDVVGIEPGVYDLSAPRGLAVHGKRDLVIRSVSGDPADVVFHGSGFHKAKGYDDTPIDDPVNIGRGSGTIAIVGITIRDSNCHGVKVQGEDGVFDIAIDHCRFFDINERMIKGSMGTGGLRVPGMRITNCHFENAQIPEESDHMATFHGNYVGGIDMMVLDDALIADNVFRNIRGKSGEGRGAIFIWGGSRGVTVERNQIAGCDRGICFGNPGSVSVPGGNDSFFVDGGVIRNNFVCNAPFIGIELAYTRDIRVLHNTVYRTDARGPGIAETSRSADRLSRNLSIAHNIVHAAIDAREAELFGNVFAESSWFADPAGGNLRLTSAGIAAAGTIGRLPDVPDDIGAKPRRGLTAPGASAP